MAKKKEKTSVKTTPTGMVVITSVDEARAALEELRELDEQRAEIERRQVGLKVAATEFCAKKKIAAIQLDGEYYRLIQRETSQWDSEKLREITKDVKVKVKGKSKSLWNLVTRRVPDPVQIDLAVKQGWITEKRIQKAYTTKAQKPFLQKYTGEAEDAA